MARYPRELVVKKYLHCLLRDTRTKKNVSQKHLNQLRKNGRTVIVIDVKSNEYIARHGLTGMRILTIKYWKEKLRNTKNATAGSLTRKFYKISHRTIETMDTEIVPALEQMLLDETAGDPTGNRTWTRCSCESLSRRLTAQGHPVSSTTVRRLLRERGYASHRHLWEPRHLCAGADVIYGNHVIYALGQTSSMGAGASMPRTVIYGNRVIYALGADVIYGSRRFYASHRHLWEPRHLCAGDVIYGSGAIYASHRHLRSQTSRDLVRQ